MKDGFVSVACGTPKLRLADCDYNAEQTFTMMRKADKAGAKVLVLPELGLTGYTCGDLFYQETLLRGAEEALSTVLAATRPLEVVTAVGMPVRKDNKLYNCAVVIQKGKILVDGYDLKAVSIESLRRQMGVMTQDNFIFSGTIRENILYGKPDATEEEMITAAKAVNAHDFIMKMEKGYDTKLQERGGGLSIGQRQLIAFARTMISMPKILILDEATSSIDTHTEVLVQRGIEALLKGRTSFVIAHRLSTIQNADRIFVIGDGGIMEQGTPTELMEKKGAYYNLYMAQFAEIA